MLAPPPQLRRITRRGAMLVVTQPSGWRMRSLKHLKPHSRRSLVSSWAHSSCVGWSLCSSCLYCGFSLFWKLERSPTMWLESDICLLTPSHVFYASSNSFIPFCSLSFILHSFADLPSYHFVKDRLFLAGSLPPSLYLSLLFWPLLHIHPLALPLFF